MNITVFFPCYNEQENIKTTVEKAVETLERLADKYEVLIIDDGSTDSTNRICTELVRNNKNIRLIRHPSNLGYGAALSTGVKNSRFEVVCFTDSDGQFDIKEIERFLPLLEKAPFVIGNRLKRSDPLHRRLNSALFRYLVRLIFRLKVKDMNCGFKVFKKEVFEGVELISGGAFITAEMLIRAKDRNYNFLEIGVTHYPRIKGKQTGANPLVVFRAFKELFEFWEIRH